MLSENLNDKWVFVDLLNFIVGMFDMRYAPLEDRMSSKEGPGFAGDQLDEVDRFSYMAIGCLSENLSSRIQKA